MLRSLRLAHKAPGMQARIRLTASVWTVLLLPLCDQTRPWFRFSKRTSSVAGLALCLVSFSRACRFSCPLLCRELYSRPFHWALTLSINTRVVDRAAIEPNRRVESEVGSYNSEVGSQKSEVGNQKWEIGSRKWEVGSGKWEVESGKWEIRSRKWEVRSRKSEVGSENCG